MRNLADGEGRDFCQAAFTFALQEQDGQAESTKDPTGLTRSQSRVVNRAARAQALRDSGRGIEATDSGALHRSKAMRRRNKTLPLWNEFVARSRSGPVHLPSVACPPESDTKAHNDYKAKVRACVRAPSCGSAGDPG